MKIYLNKVKESWIIDRIRDDWYINKKNISTKYIKQSDIVWILSPWVWNKIPKKNLESKKVLCSYYHFDFKKFDEKDFYKLDQYVDEYHVISGNTYKQLENLTNKKITSIPFWVNQNIFKTLNFKDKIRKKYGFDTDDFLVGTFQRDTESHDLKSPKLIKGPDIFIELARKIMVKNDKLKVVLTGKNRQYIISELEKYNIPFKYFEMVNLNQLNELYNILDLYLVTSRLEGGPQAILEAAITKTPIMSTDVGVAKEILHKKSIFTEETFENAIADTDYAYKMTHNFTIPKGLDKFENMFIKLYES